MAFNYTTMSPSFAANGGLVKTWNYTTTDSLATVLASGYFNAQVASLGIGDVVNVSIVDALPIASRTACTDALPLTVVGNNGTTITTRLQTQTNSLVRLFDDFEGDTLDARWGVPTKGSDGATVDFAVTVDVSGKLRGTTGADAGGTMAANGIQLHRFLNWKANQGGLMIETRVKISAITNIAVFVGLTDQVTDLECPITSAGSADTITTTATDAVGFMFDTDMATDDIWLVGVAADVDATLQDSGLAFVANTYRTLRVELSSTGVANFFIDNVLKGSAMSGAVTATVALTPVVAVFTRTAASATMDIDYVNVQALRT